MMNRSHIGERLCWLGSHKWSDPRGGIRICRRGGCEAVRLFGLSGTMRRIQWKRELYQEYQRGEGE